jgi:hypothetical protein
LAYFQWDHVGSATRKSAISIEKASALFDNVYFFEQKTPRKMNQGAMACASFL